MIELNSGTTTQYFVACNPLNEIYHRGGYQNSITRSGQPFMVYGDDLQTVKDLIFTSFVESPEDGSIEFEVVPVTWSIYDSAETVDSVVSAINTLDFLFVNSIKHPTDESWAVPFSQTVFDAIDEGATKDALALSHSASIAEGRVKTNQELKDLGWL